MLDRIPDEVVSAILDQLASPAHDEGLGIDDKAALRHVCLSSSRLRRLAQPLLWRQVFVVHDQQHRKMRSAATTTGLGRHTETYTVGFLMAHTPAALAVSRVLPNVEDVQLTLERSMPAFRFLEDFTKLRRLDLSGLVLTADPDVVLPHLDKLSITHSRVDVDSVTEWLQPSNLPALRCLHWSAVVDVGRTFLPQLDTLLHPLLLEQLDYIFTLENALAPDSELGSGTAPPVLHVGGYRGAFFPRHALFHSIHFEKPTAAHEKLREITAQLLTATSPDHRGPRPSVVVLPTQVRRVAAQDAHVARALVELERRCSASRVRVMWFVEGDDGGSFLPYSSEFRSSSPAKMSSVLPQELFDLILDKLAEPPVHYKDYCTSKDALAKAARSSRCLRSVAQANLWRNLWLIDTTKVDFQPIEAAAGRAKLGARTTTYIYSFDPVSVEGPPTEAVDVAHLFPGIVDMSIICDCEALFWRVSFRRIDMHTKLRHLVLSYLDVGDAPSGPLIHLETLGMLNCCIPSSVAGVWLRPDVLPCVRVLNMVDNCDENSTTVLDLASVIAPGLLAQLDCALVDAAGVDPGSALAKGVAPPFLFVPGGSGWTMLPRHSVPISRAFLSSNALNRLLPRVAKELHHSNPIAPFVVVLPRSVLDIAVENENTAAAVRGLQETAKAYAARIMWAPEAPAVSFTAQDWTEFRAYGRKLRLAREAAA
ncbi:hypothetical protein JCM9279_004998 [Rhodotorula babjevae]